jgi:signal transduction histidine kinase
MLVSGAVLVLACVSFFLYDLYTFKQGVTRNLSVQAQIIASNTTSALVFNDEFSAKTTLSALKASPRIVHAGIYTPEGRLFAEYRRDSSAHFPPFRHPPTGQTQAHWFERGQIASVDSILLDGKLIGFVSLRSDLKAIVDRLEGFAVISVGILLLCMVAALLLSRVSQRIITQPVVRLAQIARIVSSEKNYDIRATPASSQDELAVLIDAFNEMLAEIQGRDTALRRAHDELDQKVQERTAQLAAANKELEAFSYSVSHDLRAPLRSIDGFSQALIEDYADTLDLEGKQHLQRVRAASQRMATLIDDLLNLARVARSEIRWGRVDLSELSRSIAQELKTKEPKRQVEFVIADGALANGDSQLLRLVLENLLGNAWKYTSAHGHARIEVGWQERDGKSVYFVRDDGAGFDPRYATRLFGAFQRLHSTQEFPGTGIGLATVQRIIHRHGGEVWAEGAVEMGATFYFSL